ncbi:MAG: DNA polymerase III subunit delta [Gammaproteobacteria bacterium]|nr:DNA polymerase III subunit delta [Gammaproteobacteria bacterium]
MQIPLEKLADRLQQPLAPVFLICGDEPLQRQEAGDQVRAACREAGYEERTVLLADSGFEWQQLQDFGNNLSLFATRRLLELRLSGSPGQAGGKALQAYAAAPPEDTVLLVIGPRIERKTQSSAWYRAVDECGVLVQVWPVDRRRFAQWLVKRAESLDLQLSKSAAGVLAERVENNMLAAAQELEKLRLLCGAAAVDEETVLRAVADSARYNVFDLADAMLGGEHARVTRILRGLREEGVEAVLVLWSIARELRVLATVAAALAHGTQQDSALREAGVWSRRKPLVTQALRRGSDWQALLLEAAAADRSIKGAAPEPWSALEALALRSAGAPLASGFG